MGCRSFLGGCDGDSWVHDLEPMEYRYTQGVRKNAGKYQPHSSNLDGRKHGESAFHEDEGATPNTSQNND